MAYDDKSQEEKVAEIMSRVRAAKSGIKTEEKTSERQPRKKNLSEQEIVAEILNKKDAGYDPVKARESIALNTRCKSCGRTLSSLEMITFEDKCYDCMKEENKVSRDRFVRKYILIAFAFVVAIVLGGYCANSGSTAWRIVGVVISALVTGVSLSYVFYTNMDKILPNSKAKTQVRVVFILALGIAFLIGVLTYLSKSWILYVVLMFAVCGYLVYLAYCEMQRIKERDNRLVVFNRKSRNKEYIESITEDIEKRSLEVENASVNAVSIENKDFVPRDLMAEKKEKDETFDVVLPPETDEVQDSNVAENNSDNNAEIKEEIKEEIPEVPATEEFEDSGDFSI